MKIYKYSLILIFVFFLFSCGKETEGLSRITYYVDLELKGNSTEFINLGGTYNEPGWTAIEEGSDVSKNVMVSGSVDTSKPGLYTLNYLVYNADGFPKTAQRQVVVSDPTPSPLASGFYKVSKSSNRTSQGSGPGATGSKEYASEPSILIYQVSPAKFYISDFIGGYYEVGRGYGPAYALTGHFTLNPDNTLTANDSFLAGWGDSLDDLVNATYNPVNKTLQYTAQYAGAYDFNIIATKK
ncbi:MAG: DUF5012 domain-containing protein [Tissierellia bacterium]|nr:DUF5012 domain-containing protein [Tissierellia bacterium]